MISRVVFNSIFNFVWVPAPHTTTHSTLTLPSDPIWLKPSLLTCERFSQKHANNHSGTPIIKDVKCNLQEPIPFIISLQLAMASDRRSRDDFEETDDIDADVIDDTDEFDFGDLSFLKAFNSDEVGKLAI